MAPISRTSNSCPNCGSAETLAVSMTLAGSPATFTSCPMCEWHGWERQGEQLPLGSVLSLAAAR
jgi:hypothetical protein